MRGISCVAGCCGQLHRTRLFLTGVREQCMCLCAVFKFVLYAFLNNFAKVIGLIIFLRMSFGIQESVYKRNFSKHRSFVVEKYASTLYMYMYN